MIADSTFLCVIQPPHKVDLSNPKKTVLVEVMKATAAISVVDDYKSLGKLNFRELSLIGDDQPTDGKQAKQARQNAKPADAQPAADAAAAEADTSTTSPQPPGIAESVKS